MQRLAIENQELQQNNLRVLSHNKAMIKSTALNASIIYKISTKWYINIYFVVIERIIHYQQAMIAGFMSMDYLFNFRVNSDTKHN